jgi:hypothetical protein
MESAEVVYLNCGQLQFLGWVERCEGYRWGAQEATRRAAASSKTANRWYVRTMIIITRQPEDTKKADTGTRIIVIRLFNQPVDLFPTYFPRFLVL